MAKDLRKEDGWDKEELEDLTELITSLEKIKYEIQNCVAGSMTGCTTSPELLYYIKEQADMLSCNADSRLMDYD